MRWFGAKLGFAFLISQAGEAVELLVEGTAGVIQHAGLLTIRNSKQS
jgi:hypothetical protein